MTAAEFDDAVAQYCAATSSSETSGHRTRARNVAVGGVEYSAHLFRRGRDVQADALMPDAMQRTVRALLGEDWQPAPLLSVARRREIGRRLGLFVFVEEDHDHLQPIDWERG